MKSSKPCSDWAELVAAHHPDDLSQTERAALEAHLSSCATCTAIRAQYDLLANHLHVISTKTGVDVLAPTRLQAHPVGIWKRIFPDRKEDVFNQNGHFLPSRQFAMSQERTSNMSMNSSAFPVVRKPVWQRRMSTFAAIMIVTVLVSSLLVVFSRVHHTDVEGQGNSSHAISTKTERWKLTGSMHDARADFTATLLSNGNVLVVGGYNNAAVSTQGSAELYNPTTGTWSLTGSLRDARDGQAATLLPNGKVLVVGGTGASVLSTALSSAELYDPTTGTWSLTGSMHHIRFDPTATLLPNGKVLVVGGGYDDANNTFHALSSAELYDPATGVWSLTGSMHDARDGLTATLLPNGKVLVVGGQFGTNYVSQASAELYDPTTGTWSLTGSLHTSHAFQTATLLPDRKVLIAGGYTGNDAHLTVQVSAEIYDPLTGAWSLSRSMNAPRASQTVTLLQNGKVLVVGGFPGAGDNPRSQASAEVFVP